MTTPTTITECNSNSIRGNSVVLSASKSKKNTCGECINGNSFADGNQHTQHHHNTERSSTQILTDENSPSGSENNSDNINSCRLNK